MKKTLSIVMVLLILVIGQSFANEVKTLTLEETYQLLEENNTDIKLLDQKIALDQLKIDKAKISSDNNIYIGKYLTDDEYIEKVFIRDYDVKEKRVILEQRKREKEDTIESLKSDVYALYLDINAKDMSLKLLEKQLEQLKDDQRIVEAKLEQGLVVELTLDKVKNEIAVKENQIKDIERAIQNSVYELNQILGLPIETKVVAEENVLLKIINGELLDNIDLSDIDNLITEESSIVNAQEDLELLEIKKELIDNNIGDDNDYYDDVVEDIVDQEDVIEKAKKNEAFDIYSAVNTLKQSRNNYLTAQNTLKIYERVYAIDLIKYEIGQITFNERMSSYNQMFNQYIAANNAKQTYLTQLEDYKIKYLTESVESPF